MLPYIMFAVYLVCLIAAFPGKKKPISKQDDHSNDL